MKNPPALLVCRAAWLVLIAMLAMLSLPAVAMAQEDSFEQAVARYTSQRQSQQYESAQQEAHEALKQADTPDRKAKAMLLLAQSFEDQKQPAQALDMYEKAQAVEGLSPQAQADAIFEQALHHARQGNETAAIDCFERIEAIADVPASEHFSALRAKGYAYMQGQERDLDAARKAFNDIARIKDVSELQKSEGQYFLALIDRLEKKYDNAHDRLAKLVERSDLPRPVVAKYIMAMGDNHHSAGEHEKAIEVYRQLTGNAQASARMRSRAWLMSGISAIHLGNMALARESFEAVIALDDAPARYVDAARRRLEQISSQ